MQLLYYLLALPVFLHATCYALNIPSSSSSLTATRLERDAPSTQDAVTQLIQFTNDFFTGKSDPFEKTSFYPVNACRLFLTSYANFEGCEHQTECYDANHNFIGGNTTVWPVSECVVNNTQYFLDAWLGHMAITWTENNMTAIVGSKILHGPIIQIEAIGPWGEIDAENLAKSGTPEGSTGQLCGPNTNVPAGDFGLICAIPIIGEPDFGLNPGMSAVQVSGYNPGWCTMHTVQYKRQNEGDPIQVDILLLDDQRIPVGQVLKGNVSTTDGTFTFTSNLLWTIDLTAPGYNDSSSNGDYAYVMFDYAGDEWSMDPTTVSGKAHDSTSNVASKGSEDGKHGFQAGMRQQDTGFSCP